MKTGKERIRSREAGATRPDRRRGGAALMLLASLLLLGGCSLNRVHLTPLAANVRLDNTYRLKEKFWTLADLYIIRGERNEPLFQVRGRLFSIGDKLALCDMDGNELARISEQVISVLKRYHITRPDGSTVVFRKDLHLFTDRFTIKIPGEAGYVVRGDFWDYEYGFYRHGRLVAVVSKNLFSWTDDYAIQVARGEDDVLILAAAVVIDKIKEGEELRQRDAD